LAGAKAGFGFVVGGGVPTDPPSKAFVFLVRALGAGAGHGWGGLIEFVLA